MSFLAFSHILYYTLWKGEKTMTQSQAKAFLITNVSSEDLYHLKLSLRPLSHALEACTIVRSRGSLTFHRPIDEIPLGHLSPQESAYLQCKLRPGSPTLCVEDLLASLHHSLTIDSVD